MAKTKIEWCDETRNPVKGLCPMACDYCYARAMYKRFKWNPEIRIAPDAFDYLPKKPSRIFVGSTIELFGEWVKPEWMDAIFKRVSLNPQHTFLFLTKQPQNLEKWSPFPDNCHVGVSATNTKMLTRATEHLDSIRARVKFISIEPLLDWKYLYPVTFPLSKFLSGSADWIIIGQRTPVSAKTSPNIEWITEIVEAADKANIPVFLKDNLESLWTLENSKEPFFKFSRPSPGATEIGKLRQELPNK